MKNTKKGFTLTELLVTIAILAILATISIVGYVSFITRANESNAKNEAYQIEQIIESALILDERVYIEKAEDYFIIFVRDGNGYKVSFSTSKPNGVKISDIPQNLVDGLEYVEFGGLTYTSKAGIVVVIKEATNTPQDSAHEHTEVIDAAVDATCTSTGLTEGKHCSKCGEVLIAQTVLPIVAHSYDNDDDASCNVCGYERDVSCVHIEETINGYDSTCTKAGLTDGKKCSKCGETLVSQTVIPTKTHNEIVDNAIAATCTETGLTEGKHCSVCGTVIVAQTIIQVIDHINSDWIVDLQPTNTEYGKQHIECTVCKNVIVEDEIYPLGSTGLYFDLNEDGQSYYVRAHKNAGRGKIVIPETYNGLPVTRIADYAFTVTTSNGQNISADILAITSIIIPDTVTSIGKSAFYGCISVEIIKIGKNVRSIGESAFAICHSTVNIDVDSENQYFVSIDGSLYSKDGTTLIKYATGKNETTFVIPEGVTTIGEYAFYDETNSELESITIPSSVKYIKKEAFSTALELIYNGTKSQWYSITKDKGWNDSVYEDILGKITAIHCNDGTITK